MIYVWISGEGIKSIDAKDNEEAYRRVISHLVNNTKISTEEAVERMSTDQLIELNKVERISDKPIDGPLPSEDEVHEIFSNNTYFDRLDTKSIW